MSVGSSASRSRRVAISSRWRAVVSNQASGAEGMPSTCHRVSASAKASASASSAAAMSRHCQASHDSNRP